MATVSFTLPMTPMMISAAKKRGSVLGFMLNVVILAALIAFIWWFYKAMQKSAAPPPVVALPVVALPVAAPPVAAPALPPVETVPEGLGASVGVPSADV